MGGPVGILTGTEQSGRAGDATETLHRLFDGGDMAPPKLPGWIEVFTSSVAPCRMFT